VSLDMIWFAAVMSAFVAFGFTLYWSERRTRPSHLTPYPSATPPSDHARSIVDETRMFLYPLFGLFFPHEGVNIPNDTAHDAESAFQFDTDDMPPFLLAICCQLILIAAFSSFIIFVLGSFGRALVLIVIALCVLLDYRLFTYIRRKKKAYLGMPAVLLPDGTKNQMPPNHVHLLFHVLWGVIIQGGLLLIVVGGILIGTAWTDAWSAFLGILSAAAVTGVARIIWRLEMLPLKRKRAPWLILGTSLAAFPLFLAWGRPFENTNPVLDNINPTISPEYRNKVLGDRSNLSRCSDGSEWLINDRPLDVAVTLSGGGYRAALTHAGLLAFLDSHCIPIHYLSSVSGGSIIGASYALGYKPEDFARLLWHQKPGLPFQMFSTLSQVVGSTIMPSYNANLLSTHFSKMYFGSSTLADLPDQPVLIIDATDPEADPLRARETFFKERAALLHRSNGETLDSTLRIADVVAASGAFPGAFDPKEILWTSANASAFISDLRVRRFIDGGVVENLGVSGLLQYVALKRPTGFPQPRRPHLLLISDASKPGQKREYSGGIGIVNLFQRVEDISFEGLHGYLYGALTNVADFRYWIKTQPMEEQVSSVPWTQLDPEVVGQEPLHLMSVVLPMTAPEIHTQLRRFKTCTFYGEDIERVQHQVSTYPTLDELDPGQVEKAFWLGYSMGQLYWPAIKCARMRAKDGSADCSPQLSATAHGSQCPTYGWISSNLSKSSKGQRQTYSYTPPFLNTN
jgi:Patatin-like phospholipase